MRSPRPLSFTPDLSRAVFLKAGGGRPAEVTLIEGSKETRLTDIGAGLAATRRRTEKSLLEIARRPGDRGRFSICRSHSQPGRRVPLLVELHGGPTGVVTDSFPTPRTYPTQVFLEKGFCDSRPEFPGSVIMARSFG